jgi:xanthine/uracil permease
MKKVRRAAPFFGLHDRMPVFLALLLGFQHALAMLAGVITPPIILSNAAHLSGSQQRYLVSTSLIVCGILSAIQITRYGPRLPHWPFVLTFPGFTSGALPTTWAQV